MSFISRSFARLNWHAFAQFPSWRFWLWLSLKLRQRSLIQKYFLNTPPLPESWHYIFWFVQSGEVFSGKGKTHTHTHTHTHTYQCQVFHKVPRDDVLQESFHSLKPVHYEISIGEEEETDDTVNDNDFDEIVTMSSTSAMA